MVLEFVVNLNVFDLWVELVLVPVLVIVSMLIAYSSTNAEHKRVESLLTYIAGFFGIIILGFTLYSILTDLQAFASVDNLRDLLLAPVFTVAFLPFIYLKAHETDRLIATK